MVSTHFQNSIARRTPGRRLQTYPLRPTKRRWEGARGEVGDRSAGAIGSFPTLHPWPEKSPSPRLFIRMSSSSAAHLPNALSLDDWDWQHDSSSDFCDDGVAPSGGGGAGSAVAPDFGRTLLAQVLGGDGATAGAGVKDNGSGGGGGGGGGEPGAAQEGAPAAASGLRGAGDESGELGGDEDEGGGSPEDILLLREWLGLDPEPTTHRDGDGDGDGDRHTDGSGGAADAARVRLPALPPALSRRASTDNVVWAQKAEDDEPDQVAYARPRTCSVACVCGCV